MDTLGGRMASSGSASKRGDLASLGSRQGTNGMSCMSDTKLSGKSDGTFREFIHPMVQPFYSNLEIMDFLASQRMNVLVQKKDKTNVMHREER